MHEKPKAGEIWVETKPDGLIYHLLIEKVTDRQAHFRVVYASREAESRRYMGYRAEFDINDTENKYRRLNGLERALEVYNEKYKH